MKRIKVEFLAASEQRYVTLGDYTTEEDSGDYTFRITRTEDWRAQAALLLHEFVEAMLCKERGISLATIDEWDARCLSMSKNCEPGDVIGCPYEREHRFAENLERLFVAELGLSWKEYEEELERAGKRTRP